MKNLLYLTLVFLCVSFTTKKEKLIETDFREDYEVLITLEDRSGREVPVETLSGYYAHNTLTNKYYYSGDRYYGRLDVISDLPAGTYIIGAYDGYFDGASSQLITISDSSEETIAVTLKYWSE